MDFSITPYEIETAFTKKSKGELEEFNSVCKSVGWNYATKSYDLHIYFKEHGLEAMDIQTDDEEEFKTLELIGKKYIKSSYIQIALLLFISWIILGRLFSSVSAMKDGITQIAASLAPVGIILVINLINIKRFLKTNKKNMELGKSIEYSDSKFYFNRIFFALFYIILFIFIIYILYVAILLKNKFILIGIIPVLIGSIVGVLYRIFIKPAKTTIK